MGAFLANGILYSNHQYCCSSWKFFLESAVVTCPSTADGIFLEDS